MYDLVSLEAYIRRHIPLSQHLQFRLLSFNDDRLILSAPLAANSNDKGTMFAGSQAALMALSGWCLTTLQAAQLVAQADVLAMQNSLRYRRPVTGTLTIVASSPDSSLRRFRYHLAQGERAPLQVVAKGFNKNAELASQYQAEYLARLL